jgi:hypothetical protein
MEDGPEKRKADPEDFDDLARPAKRIKRLKPSASARDEGSAEQHESSILESIERDADVDLRENVVLDSDGDSEREVTWSPSPDREAPAARQIGRSGSTLRDKGERAVSQHAAPPFVPFPARQPTPINRLHNYFGGSVPELDSRQSKGKRSKGKGKKERSGPRRTVHNYYDGSHDGVVLIADLEQLREVARLGEGAQEVIFRTKAQSESHVGHAPTKEDMDATCTMTSFEPGIFRSKPRTWKMIEVEKQEDWRDEYDRRNSKFAGLMSKVGQSNESFKKRHLTGLLSEEIGKFQTPVGERRRNHAYIEALKAGQFNPDALIRLEDGTYKAIYLKLYEGTRDLSSFKAVTDKYGKDNVWLRTNDFDYMSHDQFDKNGTTFDAAEKKFCEYTGRTYEPNVFVRSAEGKWISREKYAEQNIFNFDQDLTKIEILILGEHNQGFLQPRTMKFMNPELYEKRMGAAHLTGYAPITTRRFSSRGADGMEAISDILASKQNRSSAPILLQTSKDELEAVDSLPPGVRHYQLYPQNLSQKSEYTGNYTRNWRSIRQDEKFREAANGQDNPYFEPPSTAQKPKRLMTDEQRRILKTPSPSPVQSDVSDDDELFVRQSPVSLPPDTSDDEARSPPVLGMRRRSSLPPDSSDDEAVAFSRSRLERHSRASPDDITPRPSVSIQQPLLAPDSSADDRRQNSGNPVVREQLAQAPQFTWLGDSSDDELPVATQPTTLHSPSGNEVERNVGRGTPAGTISRRASQSSLLDDRRSRSRDVGRD